MRVKTKFENRNRSAEVKGNGEVRLSEILRDFVVGSRSQGRINGFSGFIPDEPPILVR